MSTVIPTAEARRRHHTPQPVAFFSEHLRYTVAEAAGLLKQSVSKTWDDISKSKLAVIRDGGRTFVPGSEIVRRSTLVPSPTVTP